MTPRTTTTTKPKKKKAATTTPGVVAVSSICPAGRTATIATSSSSRRSRLFSSIPSDVSSADQTLEELKADLVSICTRSTKPTLEEVRTVVKELEEKAEQVNTYTFWIRFCVCS